MPAAHKAHPLISVFKRKDRSDSLMAQWRDLKTGKLVSHYLVSLGFNTLDEAMPWLQEKSEDLCRIKTQVKRAMLKDVPDEAVRAAVLRKQKARRPAVVSDIEEMLDALRDLLDEFPSFEGLAYYERREDNKVWLEGRDVLLKYRPEDADEQG